MNTQTLQQLSKTQHTVLQHSTPPALARIIAQAYTQKAHPCCVVLESDAEALTMLRDVRFFLGQDAPCALFPTRPAPFSPLPIPEDIISERLQALQTIHAHTAPIIVTTMPAILQPTISVRHWKRASVQIRVGQCLDREETLRQLTRCGLEVQSLVECPGSLAIRGSIVDCWSPGHAAPLRIEWDGDSIASLRHFAPNTQQTTATCQHAVISPARELLYDDTTSAIVRERFREFADQADLPVPERRPLLDAVAQQHHSPAVHALLPAFYDEFATIIDHMPDQSAVMLCHAATWEARAAQLNTTLRDEHAAADAALQCIPLDHMQRSAEHQLNTLHDRHRLWTDHAIATSHNDAVTVDLQCTALPPVVAAATRDEANPHFDAMQQHLHTWRDQGQGVTIVCHTSIAADRCLDLLRWHELNATQSDQQTTVPRGHIHIVTGELSAGWHDQGNAQVWITEAELFGRPLHRSPRKAQRTSEAFTSFRDLNPGDYVVHEQHGVAQYQGLMHMDMPAPNGQSIEHDFVHLQFAGDDKLYLPIYRLNVLQRYIGAGGGPTMLDKLGGARWEKVKARVSKTIEGIAQQLLNIYAQRKVRTGHAFNGRDHALEAFESGFPYDETPDQAAAIDATLADMQEQRPMDRLICGDVGYGKTEVAMRAAFRAAADGKQVALLCPTTLLAYQHAQSFAERFADTGLRVELLSRFRSSEERKQVLADLTAGTVDIVIGTHRLLSKDVSIPRLGLLIIDEEQRFGVTHKERLRDLRSTVDTLAMSATPIPRTLHMAMAGLRDVSIIQTPPADRHAIQTYIVPSSDQVIRTAVEKELARGGQVFFLHNRVQTIASMQERLQRLLPNARIQVAHGQLSEDALEQAMRRFLEKKADVLLCTTIIEAGIDIPSANTLIVNRADTFGLSQLYQIRGRVGRSNVQAMAYLLTPPQDGAEDSSRMTAHASRRLAALARHTDLGSGFSIAMHDLEMRGAGNLLGAEQSGHVAEIGFEMFTRLLERTIRQLQQADDDPEIDPDISVPVPALIPDDYISDTNVRLVWYKKLSAFDDENQVAEAEHELLDRFGTVPNEVHNLLQVIILRIRALQRRIEQLQYHNGIWRLRFHETTEVDPATLLDLVTNDPSRYQMKPDGSFLAKLPCDDAAGMFRTGRELLSRVML